MGDMWFTWEGRHILRRVDEQHPRYHVIYKHSGRAGDITDADNYFSGPPAYAPRLDFDAQRVDPARAWPVSLAGNSPVMMCEFILRRRP